MSEHPPLSALRDPADTAAQEHLARCPRCRIDLRLLRDETFPDVSEVREASVPDRPRYTWLERIGVGGMGEVWRVHDAQLDRTVAMKQLREPLRSSPSATARFLAEARTVARLQHPGIVPIYDLGLLPDGRHYFTMKEIRGVTLAQVIASLHAAATPEDWPVPSATWTLRRVVDVFNKVCEATGYAHTQGILHRDLKPSNVMIGEHGEVQVLDWGLVKALAAPDAQEGPRAGLTLAGTISGTPGYMSPEQARGATLGPAADVYALGAILYEILSGERPFADLPPREVLTRVTERPPRPPSEIHQRPLPPELEEIRARAMSLEPAARHASAVELAAALSGWLEGVAARQRAEVVLAAARAREPLIARQRAESARLRAEAEGVLAGLPPWASEDAKAAGWALQDAAEALEQQALVAWHESTRELHAALTHWSDLADARRALAVRYQATLAEAEASGDVRSALRSEIFLRAQIDALSPQDAVGQRARRWLEGCGALTLHTDPPGARVLLMPWIRRRRRLVPGPPTLLGTTPLDAVPVEAGSYLIRIERDGFLPVRYPIHIGRQEHWDGIPPGGTAPLPVVLPPLGSLTDAECYIPAGWYRSGGDPAAINPAPGRRLWVDGFVMARTPVTNRQYMALLDALARRDGLDAAMALTPCLDGSILGERGEPLYGWDGERFILVPDPDGDMWSPDWPVLQVDYETTARFIAGLAGLTGLPWRLPGAHEWEKAARGVDGRSYAWGNHFEPSWCRMRQSLDGHVLPAPVESYPVDESPYGVRGVTGNCREWTGDRYIEGGDLPDGARVVRGEDAAPMADGKRIICGGSWASGSRGCRLAGRDWVLDTWRNGDQGFRMARDLTLEPGKGITSDRAGSGSGRIPHSHGPPRRGWG